MSDIFSFSRFGKLVKKQFFENSRLYLFSILALFGLLAIIFGFWIWVGGNNYQEELTYVIFFVGLFVSGGIFASMGFNMLGAKDKGIYWLSVPATHLEKLLCTILFHTLLFTCAYLLCFYAVKAISVSVIDEMIQNNSKYSYKKVDPQDVNFFKVMWSVFYSYIAAQALYLLGSIYFPRYSFIITTVIGSVAIFGFIFYMVKMGQFMGGNWDLVSVKHPDPSAKNGYLLYSISETSQLILKRVVQFIWAPVFWVAAWFRLREKQI